MPSTTLALVEGGQEMYQCYYHWPAAHEVGVRPYNNAKQRCFEESVAEFLGDPPPPVTEQWQFHALIETPENVSIRDVFSTQWGMHRPTMYYSGVGDTKRRAEEVAWKQYQIELACTHEFNRIGGPNHNGDVMCRRCNRHVHDYYMDPTVHAARNWGRLIFGDTMWEDTKFTMIGHVGAIVMRVQGHPEFNTPLVVSATWLSGIKNAQAHHKKGAVTDLGEKIVALAEAVSKPGTNRAAKFIRLCCHAEDVRLAGSMENCNPKVRTRLADEADQALALCGGTDAGLEEYITGWAGACRRKAK